MNKNKYMKRCTKAVTLAAAALMLLTTASCRRDLWVYQDNFKQVELDIDGVTTTASGASTPMFSPPRIPMV